MKVVKFVPQGVIGFMSIGVALYAFSYLWINHPFLDSKGYLVEHTDWSLAFLFHFLGAGTALAIGWSQFWAGLRERQIKLHRTLGILYVGCVLLAGAPSGLYLAFFANGGFSSSLGFGMLGSLWFFTTTKALIHIRQSHFEKHKIWMIRSYALCLAAVTLRIWLPLWTFGMGMDFEPAYQAIAWFCWVPNLIIGEWVINQNWVKG